MRLPEIDALIDDRDRIAAELASATMQWNELRAKGSGPSDIRVLSVRIAALNQRLLDINRLIARSRT